MNFNQNTRHILHRAQGISFLTFSLVACSNLGVNRGNTSPGIRNLAATGATIVTPTTVDLGSSGLELSTTGVSSDVSSPALGCFSTGSDSATTGSTTYMNNEIRNITDGMAMVFSAPTHMVINSVILPLKLVGGPSGNLFVTLNNAAAGNPTATILGTSALILKSGLGTDPTGDPATFSFASPVAVAAGSYALDLQTDTSGDGANHVRWAASDAGPGCTGFGIYRYSTTSSATWTDNATADGGRGDSNNNAVRRGYFTLVADLHATSGQASWISSAFASAIWNMSTFSFSENPDGTTGTITYDVGAGEDPLTPTYSLTGKTKTQVQAATNLVGTYFYVRANLASTNAFDQAVVGDGSIVTLSPLTNVQNIR